MTDIPAVHCFHCAGEIYQDRRHKWFHVTAYEQCTFHKAAQLDVHPNEQYPELVGCTAEPAPDVPWAILELNVMTNTLKALT